MFKKSLYGIRSSWRKTRKCGDSPTETLKAEFRAKVAIGSASGQTLGFSETIIRNIFMIILFFDSTRPFEEGLYAFT